MECISKADLCLSWDMINVILLIPTSMYECAPKTSQMFLITCEVALFYKSIFERFYTNTNGILKIIKSKHDLLNSLKG